MQIKDLIPNHPVPDLLATITALSPPFTTASGRVGQTATLTDETGECVLNLWGDKDSESPKGSLVKAQVGPWKVGDPLHLVNGWAKKYEDRIEVSTGYSGRLLRP